MHEDWDARKVTTDGNDIALIHLPRPATTVNEDSDGTIVLPICIQWTDQDQVNISRFWTDWVQAKYL